MDNKGTITWLPIEDIPTDICILIWNNESGKPNIGKVTVTEKKRILRKDECFKYFALINPPEAGKETEK